MQIAADLLDDAADGFGNHGCNDWNFPNGWTGEEKMEFVEQMYRENGKLSYKEWVNSDKPLNVPDWWVMRFLADWLRKDEQ